jgi:hypothetical protein
MSPPAFTLVSCSAYSSTLKMVVIYSSETLVDIQRTTWQCIPKDSTLHNHRCENLKSYNKNEGYPFLGDVGFINLNPSYNFV